MFPFSLSALFPRCSPFSWLSRPSNLFNERLINVKAHRQKDLCHPLSSAFFRATWHGVARGVAVRRSRTFVCRFPRRVEKIERGRAKRKRREVGHVARIIATRIGSQKQVVPPRISTRFVEINESSVCQNRGKCCLGECLL